MKTSTSILLVRAGLLLAVLLSAVIARAQYFTLVFDTASGIETCDVLAATCLPNNQELLNDTCALANFAPSVLGKDRATVCLTSAFYDRNLLFPCKSKGDLIAGNRAWSNGYNTQSLQVGWKNTGRNWAKDDAFNYKIETKLEFQTDFTVAGTATPVQVYYSYEIFGGGSTSHENLPQKEDSIFIANTFTVNGIEQTGGAYNFASAGSTTAVSGWNQSGKVYGSMMVIPGQTISVAVISNILLFLNSPDCVNPVCLTGDKDDGIFKGKITFTLTPQYPVGPSPYEKLLFSLDIGSDHELMDIQQDGDEIFDPGDVYEKSSTPIMASNGFRDDSEIFTSDPMPDPMAPIILPPYHNGFISIASVAANYFDLDGTDLTDFSLINYAQGVTLSTSNTGISAFASDCIFPPDNMLISFDDDVAENYMDPSPALPVESSSPLSSSVFGNPMDRNEIFAYEREPLLGAITFGMPVLNEEEVHASLAWNPLFPEFEDDDTDALDYIEFDASGNTSCSVWYFSADHEANYFDPANGNILSPSAIYEVIPGGGFALVVSGAQLGLPAGTDIDDFEFTFFPQYSLSDDGTVTVANLLAVVFSVDDDDPATLENESGLLDPAMLYISFMTSYNFPLLTNPLADDIDGIAFWGDEFYSGLVCMTSYPDTDGDSFGDGQNPNFGCVLQPGYVYNNTDCDDTNAQVYPGAPGQQLGIDNNCDGVIDPTEALCIITGFYDSDGDGHGDPFVSITLVACVYPPGIVPIGDDCDDTDPSKYPGAPGIGQCKDNNCDGIVNGQEAAICQGDFTNDGFRNVSDLLLFMSNLGCQSNCGCFDLNGDGVVNTTDLLLFLPLFGQACP